jgi:penicillin-binding protein 1B
LSLGVCFTLIVIVYCAIVIDNLPLKIGQRGDPTFNEPGLVRIDELDPGQSVSLRQLKTYYLWSKNKVPFGRWLENLEQNSKVKLVNKNILGIDYSLPLMGIYENDCKRVYCYGHTINFSNIPGLLWKGLIGIEDYRYLDHQGVDLRSLMRALWHDLKVMRLEQGGSTLTQQLVKNLYFSNERKFSRKIKEMIASIYLEWKYSKEEILAAYFNEVEWGSLQGIRIKGVYAASLMYFDKRPTELMPFEVAILIGLLKGPYYYSPFTHADRLRSRTSIVFNKLKELRLFPRGIKPWSEKAWSTWLDGLRKRGDQFDVRSIWLLSTQKVKNFDAFILNLEQTSLIAKLKKKYPKVDWAAKTSLWKVGKKKPTEVLKLYSKNERSSRRAFREEKHQVGSLLKPVIYGILGDMGLDLETEVSTKPIVLKLKSGRWSPREAHKLTEPTTTYRKALVTSMNNPVVRAVQGIGFDKFEPELIKVVPTLLTPLSEYPAQLLGALELTIEELAALYNQFLFSACKNSTYSSVVEALSDPTDTTIRFRVGQNMGQMKFFGKTGTTNQGLSNWFIGFDGLNLFVSWVGVEDTTTAPKDLRVYGSNTAFILYRNFYESRGKHFNEMACRPDLEAID